MTLLRAPGRNDTGAVVYVPDLGPQRGYFREWRCRDTHFTTSVTITVTKGFATGRIFIVSGSQPSGPSLATSFPGAGCSARDAAGTRPHCREVSWRSLAVRWRTCLLAALSVEACAVLGCRYASATNILNDAGTSTTSKARSHLGSKAVGHDVDSRYGKAAVDMAVCYDGDITAARKAHPGRGNFRHVGYTRRFRGPGASLLVGPCSPWAPACEQQVHCVTACHGVRERLGGASEGYCIRPGARATYRSLGQELRDAVLQPLAQWAACNKKLRQNGALDIKEAEYLVSKFHSPGMMRLLVDVCGAMQLPGRTKLPSFTKVSGKQQQAASVTTSLDCSPILPHFFHPNECTWFWQEILPALRECLEGIQRALDAGLRNDIALCKSLLQAHQAASFKQALGLYEWLALHSHGEAFQQDARKAAKETKAQAAMIATWNVELKATGDSDAPSGPYTMLRLMASHGLHVIALQELNDPVKVQAMLDKARDAGLVGYTLYMPDDDVMVKSGYLTARRGQKGGFLCLDGHVKVLKCWSDSLVRVMTPKDLEELSEVEAKKPEKPEKPDAYMTAGSNIVDMAVMLVGGQPTLFLSCHLAATCKVQRVIQTRAIGQLHRKLLEEHPELASMPTVMMGDFNTTDPDLIGWEKATMKADCAKSLPMKDEHVDHLYLWCPTTPSSIPQGVWLTEAETIAASIGTQLASPVISEEKKAQRAKREKARLLTEGKNEAWHQLG
ncbi:hypothetical protein HaLaN_04219, partial [Haematococcus lacustris]